MENISSLPESEISEWKASWHDEYLKWLAAYAHTDGGKLYIGVNDDGYVVGLKDYRKLLEDLPNIIFLLPHMSVFAGQMSEVQIYAMIRCLKQYHRKT